MENSHKDYSTLSHDMQAPFRIDPEFEDKIPPIGEDEFKQLRENILTAGEVYEPLVVWDEGNILVDGHNRWKIIQNNTGITYKVRRASFSDKWAAFEWMYKNQLGRRNLTDEQRSYAIGQMYKARKQSQGGDHGNQHTKMANRQNGALPQGKTSIQIAKELGVGQKTVERAEHFANGVDALREVSPAAADKVLSGKAGTTKAEVADLAKQEPDIIEAFAQAVNEGKKPSRPKRPPKTEEEKRDLAEIEAIVADMRDPTTTPVFTIDYLIEDIELNGQAYVELLASTLTDRQALMTDENKPRIVAAINKVVENILKVRDSI